jgi:hypothetical protein
VGMRIVKGEKKRHAQKTMDGWIDGWMEKFETINESRATTNMFFGLLSSLLSSSTTQRVTLKNYTLRNRIKLIYR